MFLLSFVVIGVFGFGVTNAIPLWEQLRIIGGVDAPESFSPHMAVLIVGERIQTPMCGGSIISRRLVLTAAHCIDAVAVEDGQLARSFHLRVGSNKWNSGGTTVEVKTYFNHPQWDPDYIKYDVGILVLKKQLVLSDAVAVVQLGFDYVGGNERTLVTGWGRTGPKIEGNVIHLQPTPEDLQLLHTWTISQQQCERQMQAVAEGWWTPPIQDHVEICTFHSHGHGMCVGDSGSALMLMSTKQQIGVVSWGWGCAQGAPDVFVRLGGVRQFMEAILQVYKD